MVCLYDALTRYGNTSKRIINQTVTDKYCCAQLTKYIMY